MLREAIKPSKLGSDVESMRKIEKGNIYPGPGFREHNPDNSAPHFFPKHTQKI